MELPSYRVETRAQLAKFGAAAELIERSCYNATIAANKAANQSLLIHSSEFKSRYDSISTRVVLALTAGSTSFSPSLVERVNADAAKIGFMTAEELNPEANAAAREEIRVRSAQKIKLKTSTAYRCKKCGNNCTTYEEYQGRSGDEQSCISHKCMICGHTWRT
jgi:DNA-directed RNA polymerase subunit M/transcription elongation factor TFIIS